ncbi:MAG: YgjV family protein [Clostridia bacterium]|nr:YgjV family protein [Clostridia bacterium]
MDTFFQSIIAFFTLDPSEPISFVGQLVGFIPLLLAFVTFSLSKRSHILISKTLSDLLSAVHFLLLGEVVGGAVCIVNTARGYVFYNKGKKWASGIYIPIVFSILTLLTTILQWKGWYTLLPAVGSVLAVIGFWCNKPRLVKLFNLPAVSLWLVYSIITGSISSTLINIISIISITVSMIIELTKSKQPAKAEADEE